jgi:hypothetical protein
LEKQSNIKVENWKAGGAKIQPSFPGNFLLCVGCNVEFLQPFNYKNGLIQVFRLILIDKLMIHTPRLHK